MKALAYISSKGVVHHVTLEHQWVKPKGLVGAPELSFFPKTREEAINKAQRFLNTDMVRYYIKKHHGMLIDLKIGEFYEYEVPNGHVEQVEIPAKYVDVSICEKVVNLILVV